MDSREAILTAVRRGQPGTFELPSLEGPWITYPDPQKQFCSMLQSVGGNGFVVSSVDEARGHIMQLPVWAEAKKTCSTVAEIAGANVSMDDVDDPHELKDIDLAILPGQFAVAENAAIWVTDEALRHRCLPFIAQHLALIVPAGEIVENMHQAYQRISFDARRFGLFISGPSKTADIEQSLVIGAHGPRSLHVFLLESA
jgi:L-lactate dehydrogenase complex protein LldG